jgi:hypothetical protein
VHLLAPRTGGFRTRCGLEADNGLTWCWCQWHWPGDPLEGGGEVAECGDCTKARRASRGSE